jgi:hypothetical protein
MVFDDEWFQQNQKLLLLFANTKYGKDILCISGNSSHVQDEQILNISPNSITWRVNGTELATEVRTHNKFSKRLYFEFKEFWAFIHWWDMNIANRFLAGNLNLGFDTYGPANNTAGTGGPDGDAMISRSGVNQTFSNIRSGAGTAANNATDDNRGATLISTSTSNQYSDLFRPTFSFSLTSAGIATATAISATVPSLRTASKSSALGTPAYNIVEFTGSNNFNFASTDFANFGTTSFNSTTHASILEGGYVDFTFNSAGNTYTLSKVNSVMKFMEVLDWDFNNSFTGSWVSATTSGHNVRYADFTGTTNDPKVTITYTPASSNVLFTKNLNIMQAINRSNTY